MFRELQDSADAEERSTMQAKSFAHIVSLDRLAYESKVSTWHFTTEGTSHMNDPDCSLFNSLLRSIDKPRSVQHHIPEF